MAVYEYVCLACEHRFEQRRAIDSSVASALACPSCGAARVRRRFSVFAAGAGGTSAPGRAVDRPTSGGGCCGGGGCACGH